MPTPEVSVEEVLDQLNHCLGRTDIVLDEVLAILSTHAPPVLEYFGLPKVHAWRWAGENLEDNPKWPQVLVAASTDSPVMGMGHKDTVHISVMICTAPQASRQDLRRCLQMAQLLRGVLYCPIFRTRVRPATQDAPRQILWNGLLPTGFSPIPAAWPNYAGWIAHFDAEQPPGSQLWL